MVRGCSKKKLIHKATTIDLAGRLSPGTYIVEVTHSNLGYWARKIIIE